MRTMNRQKLQKLQLPKLIIKKPFRIRSASKERLHPETSLLKNNNTSQIKRKMPTEHYSSIDTKQRCHSSKPTSSWKNHHKEETISSDEQYNENYKLRMSSKSRASLEKEHKENLAKLENIAKLFDPKRIMRIDKSNHSHESSGARKQKSKSYKCQFRANQFIFEGKKSKIKISGKSAANEEAEEYWRKVNQSMILASAKNDEQISKDLREIMDHFITQ